MRGALPRGLFRHFPCTGYLRWGVERCPFEFRVRSSALLPLLAIKFRASRVPVSCAIAQIPGPPVALLAKRNITMGFPQSNYHYYMLHASVLGPGPPSLSQPPSLGTSREIGRLRARLTSSGPHQASSSPPPNQKASPPAETRFRSVDPDAASVSSTTNCAAACNFMLCAESAC